MSRGGNGVGVPPTVRFTVILLPSITDCVLTGVNRDGRTRKHK